MIKHKFEPKLNSVLCARCFRPKLNDLHLDHLTSEDLIASNLPTVNQEKNLSLIIESDERIKPKSNENEVINELKDRNCFGHICPDCGKVWEHESRCWPDPKATEKLRCINCYKQSIADIHRNDDILALLHVHEATPREITETLIAHEQFVYLEASKSPNYSEWCAAHNKNLQRMIELYQAKVISNRTALLRLRQEDASKLTQEEIDQHRRNAVRQKTKAPKKDEEAASGSLTKNAAKKAYKDMLSALAASIGKDQAKQMLDAKYKEQGKEIPE